MEGSKFFWYFAAVNIFRKREKSKAKKEKRKPSNATETKIKKAEEIRPKIDLAKSLRDAKKELAEIKIQAEFCAKELDGMK